VSRHQFVLVALAVALVACDLQLPGAEPDRFGSELAETATVRFVAGRAAPGVPEAPLTYQAGGVYAAPPEPGPNGPWTWHVRYPRAEATALPLTARDRADGVEFRGDVLMRFEQRYCSASAAAGRETRCESWHEATCCNAIWRWTRGAWVATPP
jgi:hypothetical protein